MSSPQFTISLKEIKLCLLLWKICPTGIVIGSLLVNLLNTWNNSTLLMFAVMAPNLLLIHVALACGFVVSFSLFCTQTPLGLAVQQYQRMKNGDGIPFNEVIINKTVVKDVNKTD